MSELTPIVGIDLTNLNPREPETPEPVCERVDPRSLFVDRSYQRSVGENGMRQIRRIIEGFCWTKYKPPICAYADDDGHRILKVLDGQHTAIAAASNPFIEKIPVMIVHAPETTAQAAAFVGQNTDRLGVTPLQLFWASVQAGDEDALTVQLVCARAGVKILRTTPGSGRYKPRETIAIKAIRLLVQSHTAPGARRIMEVLANADLAPITAHQIRAAELLMSDPEFSSKFEPDDLSEAISDLFLAAEEQAKIVAHTHRMPFWRALATVWFRKTKKKRKHLRIAA